MALINLAIKEANKSKHFFKVGAIIAKGKRILSRGYNSTSYCSLNLGWFTRHAEMDCIQKLLRKPDGLSSMAGATIYVARLTKKGVGNSKPCSMCQHLIDKYKMSVVHT